jgi:short-subunit dehydrogenase involved in D-alanine esterification of teichoic acids
MKIGLTGHTRGLGKAIYDNLIKLNNVIGFSRTNGYDVQSPNKIIESLTDCDVFINNVYYETYQSSLFLKLFEKWKDLEKTIININSSSIHQSGAWNPYYVANKKHLNDVTQSLIDKYPNKKCRIINLNLGTLDTHKNYENFNKIEVSKVAELIEWCINQPHGIEIQQLTILPTTQLK